ncbi:hypothetical protein PTI45_04095 [Paenibacillus nuruki]|uniref:ATP-grasp domain-containing protein n=1 Tax=Paenibacillus nuruki TaxID=1886670 RepID=A0A1E3KZC2_9BACL|nr:hypothetical protein [Paenibacillus nuruki]ODP26255.1 hypothetical protein PTI45_04095 [Paenibacillus nuruki]
MSTEPVTPQRILITGGRAPVALEWARLLHRNGHYVYVTESSRYHLCRVSSAVVESFQVPPPRQQPQLYLSALEQLIIEHQIDLLLPTCEEIFYIAQGLERLQRVCRVLTPSLSTLHTLHHKGKFIEQVIINNQAAPITFSVAEPSTDSYDYSVPDAEGHTFVRKPIYSRFASRVIMPWEIRRIIASKKQKTTANTIITTETTVMNKQYESSAWIAQQYIKGKAICTYSLVHKGIVIAHATYTSNYRTSRTGASVYFEAIEHNKAYEWVCQFVQGIPVEDQHPSNTAFCGQISFDFIEEDSTGILYPIECNPRTTSGIHLFQHQDTMIQALLDPESIAQSGQVIMPAVGIARVLTLPMWIAGIKYNRDWQAWKNWWNGLHQATDVVYQADDRKPFWEQFRLVAQALRTCRTERISLTEALTHDIEWNGKESL